MQPKQTYDVIILAGQGSDKSEFTEAFGTDHKALLMINGSPMIHYVVNALQASGRIKRIIIVGLSGAAVRFSGLSVPVRFVPDAGSIVDNIVAGLDAADTDAPILLCSSDLPLLTPRSIHHLLDVSEERPAELCYIIVERAVMEAQFPGSGRSFRTLVEGAFCGGDLNLVSPALIRRNVPFARALASNRKSALGLARLLGFGTILRFLTHRLRIADLEQRAGKILGGSMRAIQSPYAEIAMDVDKPHHLDVVRCAMQRRPESAQVS